MNVHNVLRKLVISVVLLLSATLAEAGSISPGSWVGFCFTDGGGATAGCQNSASQTSGNSFTFTLATPMYLRVTDAFTPGDTFKVYDDGLLFTTGAFNPLGSQTTDPNVAYGSDVYSWGTALLAAGPHSINIFNDIGCCGGGGAYMSLQQPPSPTITSSMLLASVFSASNPTPSVGTTIGDAINYDRSSYDTLMQAAENCVSSGIPPGCDAVQLRSQAEQGYAHYAKKLGQIGIVVNNLGNNVAIGATSVDPTTFDSTILGKVIKFTGLINNLKSGLQNAIGFFKALFSSPTSGALHVVSAAALDPIVIDGVSGNVVWDNDGSMSWVLSNLAVTAEIQKDYFPNLAIGQTMGNVDGLFPASTALGAFTVTSVVDPPGYNTVIFSFNQIDAFTNSVPEPTTLALVGVALAVLGLARRQKIT